ncbi:MAG: hypothetical protein PHE78_08355 [Candidatus Gastranaerophilales bacterium]|nr:hypothetical protein [Candidatus Gastranaerophilales bacterium]
MRKENGNWIVDLSFSEGEYYYRFLINDKLLINDPTANMYLPDENEMLWSVLMVNANGERLYNNEQYTVNIEGYNISNNIYESNLLPPNTKSFNRFIDTMIAIQFLFTLVTGLHTASVVWINPLGEILDVSENNLFNSDDNDDKVEIWFCLDLQNREINYPNGEWTVKLLIDGEYILEDKFQVININIYASGSLNFRA